MGSQCASQLVQPVRVFSSHCVGKGHGALLQQRMHEGKSTDQGQLDHIPEEQHLPADTTTGML